MNTNYIEKKSSSSSLSASPVFDNQEFNDNSSYNAEMQKLIPIVNKVQDICSQLGTTLQIDLPQIAVIGSQSAGKSSVLENIVGREFLPRGAGLVTRCPLILKLVNAPEEYGEFSHVDRKFTNYTDIRREIQARTNHIAGSNRISPDPINLCIRSPNVMNLTLVDLPGMVKLATGNEPADIEEQVKNMIRKYISNDNCLILAVSPANNDLANSDALKLSREVDPDGLRTIGVITKLDIMDAGTDARNIFEGKEFPLRRGYIGVRNRSQEEIEKNVDIATALEKERKFFETHPYYHRIAERLGTPHLQKVLNQQLTQHIRDKLPGVRDDTRRRMVLLEKEVADFAKLHPEDPLVKRDVMFDVIRKLQIDFQTEIGSLGARDIDSSKLSSGAKIRRIILIRFPKEVANIQYTEEKLRQKIRITIDVLYGYLGGSDLPYGAFQKIIRDQVADLEQPIKICVDAVIEELSNAVRTCTQKISNFPQFRDSIENDVMSFIHQSSLSFLQNVLSLAKMQAAYMNVTHSDFKNYQISESSSTESTPKSQNQVNEVIFQGNLLVETEHGETTRYSFVLTSKSLKCSFKPYILKSLDGVKHRGTDEETNPNQFIITLFRQNGENVVSELKELKLICENENDYRSWKDSFDRVLSGKLEEVVTVTDDELGPCTSEVDAVYNRVNSYMGIVMKTMCDMVPKAIALFIIQKLEDFIQHDLLKLTLNHLDEDTNFLSMVGPSPEDVEKFKAKEKMLESCKRALEVMII